MVACYLISCHNYHIVVSVVCFLLLLMRYIEEYDRIPCLNFDNLISNINFSLIEDDKRIKFINKFYQVVVETNAVVIEKETIIVVMAINAIVMITNLK